MRSLARSLALPSEHGGWGLVLEPLALGLLVARSVSGLLLALSLVAVFLARHPFLIARGDRRRERRYPRTRSAEILAGSWLALALGVAALVFVRAGVEPFLPLLAALPFIVVFAAADARGAPRATRAETAAAAAAAAGAAAVARAGGAPALFAWALWGVAAARSVPAVLYVRARLRLERGERTPRVPAVAAHVVGLGGVALLVAHASVTTMAIVAEGLLLLRAVWGLSRWRRAGKARAVGIAEIGWGAVYVLLVGLGV